MEVPGLQPNCNLITNMDQRPLTLNGSRRRLDRLRLGLVLLVGALPLPGLPGGRLRRLGG